MYCPLLHALVALLALKSGKFWGQLQPPMGLGLGRTSACQTCPSLTHPNSPPPGMHQVQGQHLPGMRGVRAWLRLVPEAGENRCLLPPSPAALPCFSAPSLLCLCW